MPSLEFMIVAMDKQWQINEKLMGCFQEQIFIDGRPYGRKMKAFRMKNDPKYDLHTRKLLFTA